MPKPGSVIADTSVDSKEMEQTNAEALLEVLEDCSALRDARRKAVLEAEVVSFNAVQIDRLKPLLRRYIERYRDSDDPTDIVAVASAIRTYVAHLDAVEVAIIDFVLEPGHRAPVPLEIELEVAKMVVRNLTVNLPQEPDSMPDLSNHLMDLARTYLSPRLLPRQYYAATVLNSILALWLLRSCHLEELYGILSRLPVSWFKQLTVRRAQSIAQELADGFPENAYRAHRDSLGALIQACREEVQ